MTTPSPPPTLDPPAVTPKPKRGRLTPAGRARAGKNAARHGLYADSIVIPGAESEKQYQAFRAETIENANPVGPIEHAFAVRVAELLWRIRRVARAEQRAVALLQHRDDAVRMSRELESAANQAAKDQLAAEIPDETERAIAVISKNFYASGVAINNYVESRREPRLLPEDKGLDKIIRYEAHLGRQLYHALHELEALQQRRLGKALPLARVDVHGLPGT